MVNLLVFVIVVAFLLFLMFLQEEDKKHTLTVVSGIVSFSVFLLILVSMVTYKSGNIDANLGGRFGYSVAQIFIDTFGYILGYYLIFSLLVMTILLAFSRLSNKIIIKLSALFLILFFLSGYIKVPFSGSIAVSVFQWIENFAGIAGKIIVSLLFILLSIYVLFPGIFGKKGEEEKAQKKIISEREIVIGEKTAGKVKRRKTREKPVTSIEGKPYVYPAISGEALIKLLNKVPVAEATVDREECEKNKKLIEEKLKEFGVDGRVVAYYPGPVVTRYEYEPAPGIKLSRIVNLADDLALRMKSNKIRIVAPLPEKGLIGIEVPNRKRRIVYFRELAEREEFRKLKSPLGFALGVDTAGNPVYADLSKMPHLLIAGATGSGKSVCINTIITSVLLRATPEEVRFLLIDPKRIELSYYEGIPHLMLPVVKDRKLAVEALKSAVKWMDIRYRHFARDGVRDIESHNKRAKEKGEELLPYVVIIIDEFADLILTTGREIEEPLARLAQMARAVGIHLVVATQRPSVDVITGMIKANFPVRIAFKVPSKVDSRTILDEMGAEKLLGRGDMLFIPPGTSELLRLHGPFVSEEETKEITKTLTIDYIAGLLPEYFPEMEDGYQIVKELVERNLHIPMIRIDEPGLDERENILIDFLLEETGLEEEEVRKRIAEIRTNYYRMIPEMLEVPLEKVEEIQEVEGEYDSLLEEAAKLVVLEGKASATLLQRKLKVGFARAARIIDQLEEIGVIGPQEGTKARKVLVSLEELDNLFRKH